MANSKCPVGPSASFTISDPEFYIEPFADYEWMLEQPIWRDPATNFWVVTRYQDVRSIAMHPRLWSSNTNQIFTRVSPVTDQVNAIYETEGWLPLDTLVTNDPPDHKRYRTLVDKAFAPARVKRLGGLIDGITDQLVENLLAKGRCDFVQEFAIPMAIGVISNQVGGAGPEDIPQLRAWTEMQLELINPVLTPERELELTRGSVQFQQWIAGAIERVKASPDETILSGLITAEVDGERLNMRELIAIALQFFAAGHDTTTSATASAMLYLARQPELFAQLKAEPEKIPNFVEEVLRVEGPVQRLFRRATSDTQIGDVTVKEGEIALIQWGGANRDGARFACPAKVDLDRENITAHLAFGSGIHFCVGNQLARAELASAVRAVVTRCGSVALADGENSITYRPEFISRSPARLDVVVTPA
jgi:cytochrome P450